MSIVTVGVDLAKSIFQIHGVDENGVCVLRRQLRRAEVKPFFEKLPACLVGMEACPGSHFWGRALTELGHQVRLMPAQYVKAYVKTNKNDAADAEAICEAVTRPNMRFVPIKSATQQSVLMIHRLRELLVRQRTQLINAVRGHLAEFGIVGAKGVRRLGDLMTAASSAELEELPELAREMVGVMVQQLQDTQRKIDQLERRLVAWSRLNDVARRLLTIPGIGPITATALVASVADPTDFRSGRHFAAWLGLVPRQNSTGGKQKLGAISKRGDGYLRTLLIHGSRSVMRWSRTRWEWLTKLLQRRPANVAAVAMANKAARIAWVVMARGVSYEAHRMAA